MFVVKMIIGLIIAGIILSLTSCSSAPKQKVSDLGKKYPTQISPQQQPFTPEQLQLHNAEEVSRENEQLRFELEKEKEKVKQEQARKDQELQMTKALLQKERAKKVEPVIESNNSQETFVPEVVKPSPTNSINPYKAKTPEVNPTPSEPTSTPAPKKSKADILKEETKKLLDF